MDKQASAPLREKATVPVLVVFALALLVVVATAQQTPEEEYLTLAETLAHREGEETVVCNMPSGSYEGNIQVRLSVGEGLPEGTQVVYTLDGSDPTPESKVYRYPLPLRAHDPVHVVPLKAALLYNGELGGTICCTYALGWDKSEFGDVSLVSVTSDPSNLYDYETGILVKGKLYDEQMEQRETEGGEDPLYVYGNLGADWTRPGHAVLWDTDGSVEDELEVGVSVSGGTSRLSDSPSLKLDADEQWDADHPHLEVASLYDGVAQRPYSMVESVGKLRLRSGGQDRDLGHVRSAIVSELAAQSGFCGSADVKHYAVFLNGEYYELAEGQQVYTAPFLARRFGLLNSTAVEKVKGSETDTLTVLGVRELFMADLSTPGARRELEKHVDMDDFLRYYAIEVLCNNTDWPGNSFEAWRYTGGEEGSNRWSDGRIRFLIVDTDLTWQDKDDHEFFAGSLDDTLRSLILSQVRASDSVFPHVMESSYYRSRFLAILADYLATSFSARNVTHVMREELDKVETAFETYHSEEACQTWEACAERLVHSGQAREEQVEEVLAEEWGLDARYDLRLTCPAGCSVVGAGQTVYAGKTLAERPWRGADLELTARPNPGYAFDHWLVNGKVRDGATVTLTEHDVMADGTCAVEPVVLHVDEARLVIEELSAKGDNDWVRVRNVGTKPVKLEEYWLSDDVSDLQKSQLPRMTLDAGDELVLHSHAGEVAIGDYQFNFRLGEGETLYLTDRESTVQDSCWIPVMESGESYRRNEGSDDFVYVRL